MSFTALWPAAKSHWRKHMRVAVGIAALVVVLIGIAATGRTTASDVNVLVNGNFEDSFVSISGCGSVGQQWSCFTNGGGANFGFYDDQWEPVVDTGQHSQLIEISTVGVFDAEADRTAGIYQTVPVVPHANYTFSLKGLIRTTELDGDPWRYRVEVGWVQGVAKDWRQVLQWHDVGWDTYHPNTDPGSFSQYTTNLTTTSDRLTIFVRVLKKWGVPEVRLNVNFDGISLTGPAPYGYYPPLTATPTQVVTAPPSTPSPGTAITPLPVGTCAGPQHISNSGFDQGFQQTHLGSVGLYWAPFTSGGVANYGFFEGRHVPALPDSQYSQVIDINTRGISEGEHDRRAGVYQTITGLTAGATYQLTVKGRILGLGGGDDPYRFETQWGYALGRSSRWEHVIGWQGLDLGSIQPRDEPRDWGTTTVHFVAPAPEITIFVAGLKKWGTGETEMVIQIDTISVQSCDTAPPPPPPGKCSYVVKPGDTLAIIAAKYGVSVHLLASVNHIANPNYIAVGQILTIPECVDGGQVYPTHVPPPHQPVATPDPAPAIVYYTVKPGDSLSAIAQRYSISVHHLAQVNGIANINHIYVGQVLIIP